MRWSANPVDRVIAFAIVTLALVWVVAIVGTALCAWGGPC
jgi:hypothetical protein